MNEVTFVGKLGAFTSLRADHLRRNGEVPLIATGDLEEQQRDNTGASLRCDMRLANTAGRKLVSGEMKRPEHPDGSDPRNLTLVNLNAPMGL